MIPPGRSARRPSVQAQILMSEKSRILLANSPGRQQSFRKRPFSGRFVFVMPNHTGAILGRSEIRSEI